MGWDRSVRSVILNVAAKPWLRHWMEEAGWRFGVQRFVAGETLDQAIRAVNDLYAKGLDCTLDLLGESVSDLETAKQSAHAIDQMLRILHKEGSHSHISIKLTQLGLLIDPQFCEEQMNALTDLAKAQNQFIRIDMEDSSVTGITLDLFQKLHARVGSKHIGIVVQSYLYRTPQDIHMLGEIGASVRVVKGAYLEPPEVAYPEKMDVDRAYVESVKSLLTSGNYTAIATHDRAIIGELIQWISDQDIPRHQFEFQMLYGICCDLQHILAHDGFTVRVYTPFGTHWYPYFSRRLAERPANMWFFLRHLWPK